MKKASFFMQSVNLDGMVGGEAQSTLACIPLMEEDMNRDDDREQHSKDMSDRIVDTDKYQSHHPAGDVWALSSSEGGEPSPKQPSDGSESGLPRMIGRYVVQRRLGRGGFGVVYLARDQDLGRDVAIKVPKPGRLAGNQKLVDFIEEARKTAQFDHPSIVHVYDVQREPDFVYIVEQYIDGSDLDAYAKSRTLSTGEIAELMIGISDAIGYAHDRGFIHRDLKPANILIDHRGKPHVADFGLAVHENATEALAGQLAGTYPYMSPEQVRGESHRLDARSDIWSLGVILYQLLTGEMPFKGSSRKEVLSSIVDHDPDPLRDANPTLSGELTRICLCCLEKRSGDRFQSVQELIADLRHWLRTHSDSKTSDSAGQTSGSSKVELAIEPQGLRTFEGRHADFFLQLVPGPHDREGLPKSIRFWKTRIECRNPDETFSVGVMYGPSGCGKSSIVQAGIFPRLSGQIRTVLVQAPSRNAIGQIARKLSQTCPEVSDTSGLAAMIGRLRELGGSDGRKVLIVLDQFEQFLHANHQAEQDQLALALRQADGAAVQVLILVRDDFYASINRFFNRLEIPILEGRNAALVDVFNLDHARNVLMAFGRAYGRVPALPAPPQSQHVRFVDRAIEGLSEDERVTCVRLVVFAEMMKARPWDEQALRDVGGIHGVGVTFLQEQFSKPGSPPVHRVHEDAVRGVLGALASGDSSQLKGPVRSYQQLMDASGYQQSRDEFDVVLQILDRDLRLITPVESVGSSGDEGDRVNVEYQLAHDYLTHAVRRWLNLHQMETRRGRAQLRLDERATVYAANPERRNLPSFLEYFGIAWLTDRRNWTSRQRAMMRSARRLHLGYVAVGLGALLLLGLIAYWDRERDRADDLVGRIQLASPDSVPALIEQLSDSWTERLALEKQLALEIAGRNVPRQVKLRLALLAYDPGQVLPLRKELLNADLPFHYLPLLASTVVLPQQDEFVKQLRDDVLRSATSSDENRLRAGIAIANCNPTPDDWNSNELDFLATQLVRAGPDQEEMLRDCLRPIRLMMKEYLLIQMSASEQDEIEKLSLARALADYYQDDIEVLTGAVSLSTPAQFRVLYEPLAKLEHAKCNETLTQLARNVVTVGPRNRVSTGRAKAGVAIASLRLMSDDETASLRLDSMDAIASVLSVNGDPESLTQFVHGLRDREVSQATLAEFFSRIVQLTDSQVEEIEKRSGQQVHQMIFGLLSALGEFALQTYPEVMQEDLVEQVAGLYEHHRSSAVHGVAGWLLRTWRREEEARRIDQRAIAYEEGREWFTLEVQTSPQPESKQKPEAFFMTFVVFEPGDYLVGSRIKETGRGGMERRRRVRIPRRFAILDRELSNREIMAWSHPSEGYQYQQDSPEQPYGGINWYDSVEYCRWLSGLCNWNEADQPYPDKSLLDTDMYPIDTSARSGRSPRCWPVHLNRLGFRLPTQVEWEVACRAGMNSVWSFGDDVERFDDYAWNFSNSEQAMLSRMKRPNLRGIFDMHGNRQEWCHDWYGPPLKNEGIEIDNGGRLDGTVRVVRGGGYRNWADESRCGALGYAVATMRPIDMGLRIVMTLPTQAEEGQDDHSDATERWTTGHVESNVTGSDSDNSRQSKED